jgi:hypothetical protein
MTALPQSHGKRALPLPLCIILFCSPTLYFLLLLLVDRFQLPAPPALLIVSLFITIPIVALIVCGRTAWSLGTTKPRKIGWTAVTLLGITLQVAVLLVIVVIALTAAISYAQ